MHALVIVESIWGNSEQVGRAIAEGLGGVGSVEVASSEIAPVRVDGYDLLVVGGPTHAFSMSRPSTRSAAVTDRSAPRLVERGIREWMDSLVRPERSIPAFAFDTRVDQPRLPGSAAKVARRELRSIGFDTPLPARTFRVHGYSGPLLDGELERARDFGREIARTAMPAAAG